MSEERFQKFHLEPIAHGIDEQWPDRAIIALEAGYTIEVIANTLLPKYFSWSGNESDMWANYAKSFQPLTEHPDSRIRKVAKLAIDKVLLRQVSAQAEERSEAIYGLD